jgi:hypothetical protein
LFIVVFFSFFCSSVENSSLFDEWAFKTLVSLAFYNSPKNAQFTHERVEYNVFLLDEPFKGSKSLETFKISLTFRFDRLGHLSKSVHIGENSQILTASNKKMLYATRAKSVIALDVFIHFLHLFHK